MQNSSSRAGDSSVANSYQPVIIEPTSRFQLKIAVLGNQSVGKTTLINSLFQDQFGSVSDRRCTAAVHHYHIEVLPQNVEQPKTVIQSITSVFLGAKPEIRPAAQVYDKVKETDKRLRRSTGMATEHKVEECHWNVKCPEIVSIDETIPQGGLDLVFVDVPGINCPDRGEQYKKYVADHFSDFDYFIVMVDGDKFKSSTASEMGSPNPQASMLAGAGVGSSGSTSVAGRSGGAGEQVPHLLDDANMVDATEQEPWGQAWNQNVGLQESYNMEQHFANWHQGVDIDGDFPPGQPYPGSGGGEWPDTHAYAGAVDSVHGSYQRPEQGRTNKRRAAATSPDSDELSSSSSLISSYDEKSKNPQPVPAPPVHASFCGADDEALLQWFSGLMYAQGLQLDLPPACLLVNKVDLNKEAKEIENAIKKIRNAKWFGYGVDQLRSVERVGSSVTDVSMTCGTAGVAAPLSGAASPTAGSTTAGSIIAGANKGNPMSPNKTAPRSPGGKGGILKLKKTTFDSVFPVSALGALGVRIASSRNLKETVSTVDYKCIEMIAQTGLPLPYEDWKELKEDKRQYEVVQYLKKLTPEEREKRLKKNNFLAFLSHLEDQCGKKAQKPLLIKMIKRQMNRMAVDGLTFDNLVKFHARSRHLCDGVDIGTRFREIFCKTGHHALQMFRYFPTAENIRETKKKIFDLLADFLKFVEKNFVASEKDLVLNHLLEVERRAFEFLEEYLTIVQQKGSEMQCGLSVGTSDGTAYAGEEATWTALGSHEWSALLGVISKELEIGDSFRSPGFSIVTTVWGCFARAASAKIEVAKVSNMAMSAVRGDHSERKPPQTQLTKTAGQCLSTKFNFSSMKQTVEAMQKFGQYITLHNAFMKHLADVRRRIGNVAMDGGRCDPLLANSYMFGSPSAKRSALDYDSACSKDSDDQGEDADEGGMETSAEPAAKRVRTA